MLTSWDGVSVPQLNCINLPTKDLLMQVPHFSHALLTVILLATPTPVSATLIISFGAGGNGTALHGDEAGDTAGPFTDPMTGGSGTITTDTVLSADGSPGGSLRRTTDFGGRLGVDSFYFSGSESWSFHWDVPVEFAGFSLTNFNNTNVNSGEQFQISSEAWENLSITPTSSKVSFNATTGTFTFDFGPPGDSFDESDLGGPAELPVGEVMTIAYTSTITDSFNAIDSMSFNITVVPESSQVACGALVCVVVGLFTGGKKRRARGKSS